MFFFAVLIGIYFSAFDNTNNVSPNEGAPLGTDELTRRLLSVIFVFDGDTVRVETPNGTEKVRLIGVDAPERAFDEGARSECFADAAAEYVQSRILNEHVYVVRDPRTNNRDKHGRLLRYIVTQEGSDIGADMLRQGYVELFEFETFSKKFEYRQLETEARRASRGLWNACL